MDMTTSVTIEAALYNEHSLVWEPLIEPTIDSNGFRYMPWLLTYSVDSNPKDLPSTKSKTHMNLRFDQLLNITMTKSGLELVQRLSTLFNDVYNQRLPPGDDDDQPMLSLWNQTGQNITISNLDGLQVNLNRSIIEFIFNEFLFK